MTERSVLLDIGEEAQHREADIDVIRRKFSIPHHYFDCWIYGFLKNKKFNINETIAKLERRFAMEVNELATYEITDEMRISLRRGIVQELGFDKIGRTILYICARRDVPSKHLWDMRLKSFDMFVSYATRLRKECKRCQLVLLVDQKGASLFKNIDLRFQAHVALRISKFYPGMIDKIYVCNMSGMLATCMKPIIMALPAVVSSIVEVLTDADIKHGSLRKIIDEDILPVDLGGRNECDNQEHWDAFCDNVMRYYTGLKRGVNEHHLTVKEWELRELGISGKATPLPRGAASLPSHPAQRATSVVSTAASSFFERASNVTPSLCLPRTCSETFTDLNSIGLEEEEEGEEEGDEALTWRRIMCPFDSSVALSFLEELLHWRNEVESAELYERLHITNLARARLADIVNRNPPIRSEEGNPRESAPMPDKGNRVHVEEVPKQRKRLACCCHVT
ncbi:unnamed protein product [Phytomonas sp. EM1]|nr:unnamed protein product [Phytomonas sp. EM1]|eukprot:CCW65418.1 unnamed protein product [Phytomonas sp. isolate EM1]